MIALGIVHTAVKSLSSEETSNNQALRTNLVNVDGYTKVLHFKLNS
ncbi:hypothetical protein GPLA_2135 [Paraglaciecola polaris LMG 21857]|uniref:Uncharacterized protein n=1 Tax=Paraglaciecola polaris LMG 21857 TaxID=1129793 RepID=K7ACF8_9ALTE|nr:hypothetical protein GPLA_2135 [Paraglaciecola polaris LMG 21857]